jgi:hypothetical protein
MTEGSDADFIALQTDDNLDVLLDDQPASGVLKITPSSPTPLRTAQKLL